MRTEFQNRYKPFVDLNPESRFATREEIRDSGTWIDISEASVGAAGIPLMIEKNHLLIDAEDHHNAAAYIDLTAYSSEGSVLSGCH